MPTSARRFGNRAVGFDRPVPPVRSRGDVGIAPYANGGILPFIRARFFGGAGVPSSGPGYARSTFPVGEGFLRRGKATSGGGSLFRSVLDL